NAKDVQLKLNIFIGDIFGGLNAAIIALPQALAFGVATGFGAGAGVWGAIILCLTAGILGTKVPMISGITGPSAIVIASIMHALNKDINSVLVIMVMAGILQMALSLTKLTQIVKYVPYPVISGFMNGVGTIIIIMQLNPLLGLKPFSNTIESIEHIVTSLHTMNVAAFLLGLLTLVIVFAIPKRLNKYIPSQILALIVCTLISIKLGLNIPKISEVSIALPAFKLPETNLHDIITYFHYAITLAIILSSETLLTGLVCNSLTKTQLSPRTLLASQGFGNILCSLTGSLPGGAATMRTVAALKSGASTKIAAIVCPIVLVILLFKFSNFVAEIPLCVLAGILIKIGYDIIDVKLLKVLKLASKEDKYVLAVVFLLTVFYNLIVAVGAGITLAALLYAKKLADSAKLIHKEVYDADIVKLEREVERDYKLKIRVVHINGQFFFGSATQLISQFDEILGTRYLILNCDFEEKLDISALFAFEDIVLRLQSQHIKLVLVLKNEEIYKQLLEYKITEQIGTENIFYSELDAIKYAKDAFSTNARKKYNK
uniref:SulP family inorganic anion transporter n=1 Tax=Candidatus Scatousia sp. TaxID=3085663 RepID=UPI004026A916